MAPDTPAPISAAAPLRMRGASRYHGRELDAATWTVGVLRLHPSYPRQLAISEAAQRFTIAAHQVPTLRLLVDELDR